MNTYRVVRILRGAAMAWGVERRRPGCAPDVIQEFWAPEEAEAAVQTLLSIDSANHFRGYSANFRLTKARA